MTQAPDITTREELRQFGRDLCRQQYFCEAELGVDAPVGFIINTFEGLTVAQGYGLATDEIAEIVLSGYRVQLVEEQKPFPLP